MLDPIEPKETQSVGKTADDFLDKHFNAEPGEEQPEGNAPLQNEQETPEQEGESDSLKTPSTERVTEETDDGEAPKGFAEHPKWQKIIQQKQEALKELEERRKTEELYSKLLDDPQTYRKFLELQGYSREFIERKLAESGFEQAPKPESNTPTKRSIAEDVCAELGWDINRLDDKQKAYLNDQAAFIQKLTEKMLGKTLETRLKPMEGYLQEVETNKKIASDYDNAKRAAKAEFPELDWEKDIEPAMARYLDDLDKKDPKGAIRIDAETLYEKATRQLLKEKKVSEERQEVRNELKKNSRPLVPGASKPTSKGSPLKGKNPKETADLYLNSIGFKD